MVGRRRDAWTVLDLDSYNALRIEEPSASNQTMRLKPNLTTTDLSGSAITDYPQWRDPAPKSTDGLKLTATSNLPRGIVAEMC
jgi:hypothetical protein